jgi:PAS domain S-box-containing protein
VSRATTLSLQHRIVVLVLLIMTAMFAFFAVWTWRATGELRAQILREREVSAQLAAARIDGLLNRDLAKLQRIGHELTETTSAQVEPQQALLPYADPDGPFSGGVFLLDRTGHLIAGTVPIAGVPVGAVVPQSGLLGALVGDGGAGVSGAVPFGANNERSFLVAVSLPEAYSQVGATLAGVVHVVDSVFVEAIRPLAPGQTGYAEIVDKGGQLLVDTLAERSFGDAEHQKRLAALVAAGRPETIRCHNCHATSGSVSGKQMMVFAPVKTAAWGVVASQSEGEILAPLRQLQWFLLWGGLVIFAFALSFGLFAGRNVVRPLNRLMLACESIAGGNLERPVPAVGLGEIRRLALAVDTVRERLAAALSETRAWNAVLEDRVREKTEELSRSCSELQASSGYLQSVIDSLTDELQIVAQDGTLLQVNAARLASTGRRRDELVGRQCCLTLCGGQEECQREEGRCLVSVVWETGRPGRSTSVECGGQTEGRFLDVAASPLRDAAGRVTGVVEVMRDVTESRLLQEEVLQRNRELSALNEVLLAASESLELRTVLSLAAQAAAGVFRADAATILLAPRGGEILWHTGVKLPEPQVLDLLRRARADNEASDGSQQPIILDDLLGEDEPSYDALAAFGIRSLALVSLRFGERPVASLALAFCRPCALSAGEAGLLGSISGQLALAIDHALLYQEQQRAAARASSLLRVAGQISSLESLDRVLERIVGEASALLGTEKARIVLFGEDGLEAAVSASAGVRTVSVVHRQPRREQGLGGLAVSTLAPVWTPEYTADARLTHAPEEVAYTNGLHSAIAAPLLVGARAIGVLYLAGARPDQFQEEDASLLLGFANHAAIAIENARLYAEAGKVEALRELDKLRSRLVSTVSHELRTPLAGMKAYTTALLRRDLKRDEHVRRQYLRAIDQDCDRLTNLIDELLDMSRIEAGLPGLSQEPLSAASAIERAIAAVRPVAKRREIVCDANADLPPAWADPVRLHQVLSNLLGNAVKFSASGTSVTVSASVLDEDILFTVADQGVGMRADQCVRIFEPFYSGDGNHTGRPRGTGLGLAICKGIVEAHGGRIWVESKVGAGSTFCFTVPVHRAAEG